MTKFALKSLLAGLVILLHHHCFAAGNPYSAEETLRIEKACIDLGRHYARALDQRQAERVAEVFADNGNWTGQGGKFVGRDDIRTAFSQRPKDRISLHLLSNENAEVISRNMTLVTSNFLLLRGDGNIDKGALALNSSLNGAGIYEDECVRTDDGWLLQSRKMTMIFSAEPPAAPVIDQ